MHLLHLLLTTEGESLYEQCLRLRKELETARSICQNLRSEPEGDMHVVVFAYFAKQLIFPRLKAFLEGYPKLKLRIDTTEADSVFCYYPKSNFMQSKIKAFIDFFLPEQGL